MRPAFGDERASFGREPLAFASEQSQLACMRLVLACVHLCGQLAEAMKASGWTVERIAPSAAADGGVTYGERVEVATGADEATQNAADALADTLEGFQILAQGPDDMAPQPSGAPVRVTVGPR